MKHCFNPVIRAHLSRCLCLILLVAVCIIPFALGQRATTKQSAVADPLLLGSGPAATLSTRDAPASETWTFTGSLNTARYAHTATLLQNGMVLVAGGIDSNFNLPRARNCTTRRAGPGLPRAASTPHAICHTATLLQNGMVLVAGGVDSNLQCFRERGTVRPGERDLDCHRQPQHRTLLAHGDVATKRHGPCCRGI